VARLARVADAAGRHEVIVFYMENADARYPDGLVDVDEDGDGRLEAGETEHLWQALSQALDVVSIRNKGVRFTSTSCERWMMRC
jgi:hypothetical protein